MGGTNLDNVAAAVARAGHLRGEPAPFLAEARDGERFLEELYGARVKGSTWQVRMSTIACGEPCGSNLRILDVVGGGVGHESKVGYVQTSDFTLAQIRKDAWLIENGYLDAAQWHFFASSRSGKIGASKGVLDALDGAGIGYTIHLPV